MAAMMAAKSVNAHISFHKEVRMLIKEAKYMFSRPRNTLNHLSNVQGQWFRHDTQKCNNSFKIDIGMLVCQQTIIGHVTKHFAHPNEDLIQSMLQKDMINNSH